MIYVKNSLIKPHKMWKDTIGFNRVNISTFVIEHNGRPSELKRFRELFNGLTFEDSRPMYSELKADGQDVFFLKNKK